MTEALQHTINGIVLERAEVYGPIVHTQGNLRQLVIDLDHVDAAIHNFDPSIELGEIKSRPVQLHGRADLIGDQGAVTNRRAWLFLIPHAPRP
jgi:hypothetical protein